MKLYEQPAHVLHKMLLGKEVSAVELATAHIDRMREMEPALKAFLTPTPELALRQAAEVDKLIAAGEPLPFLAGIPGAVKDNISTKGVRTTCASKILEHYVPPYDATVMRRLAGQRAVIMGKANLDEFAMGGSTENSAYQATRNPRDASRVPGGSSGGSAAAVAGGEAVWALGSDTGGSIRQPASFCGIVGLKPTYGRVSRYGLVAFASSLDQIGPLTRDVTDCAHLLNVLSGHDEMDSTSSTADVPDFAAALVNDVRGLKIGLPREFFVEGLDPDVGAAVHAAVDELQKQGATVVDISLPHTKYAIATYYLVAPAEAATNLERYDGVSYGERVDGADIVELMTSTRSALFGPEVKRRILIGNYALSAGYYDAYYLKALKVRTLIQQDYTEAFKSVDVIVTPTTPGPAFRLGELLDDPLQMYLQDICTVPVNLAGLPAISLPCGLTSTTRLPIGLQIIGRPMDEATVLRAAFACEQSRN